MSDRKYRQSYLAGDDKVNEAKEIARRILKDIQVKDWDGGLVWMKAQDIWSLGGGTDAENAFDAPVRKIQDAIEEFRQGVEGGIPMESADRIACRKIKAACVEIVGRPVN